MSYVQTKALDMNTQRQRATPYKIQDIEHVENTYKHVPAIFGRRRHSWRWCSSFQFLKTNPWLRFPIGLSRSHWIPGIQDGYQNVWISSFRNKCIYIYILYIYYMYICWSYDSKGLSNTTLRAYRLIDSFSQGRMEQWYTGRFRSRIPRAEQTHRLLEGV